MTKETAWSFLNGYRGKFFEGTWPTLSELIKITIDRYPEKRGFTLLSPRELLLTYKDIGEYINQISQYLRSIGLDKGDKIGLTGKNSPEWALAYLSILSMGGIVVPIDYQLETKNIESLMEFADVKVAFIDEEKYDSMGHGTLRFKEKISLSPNIENYILNKTSQKEIDINAANSNDTAAILFTSGTTGNPKGVMLTHENLVSDCLLAQNNLHLLYTDVFYALLPLHHIYTMLAVFIEAISVGADVVFGQRIATPVILNDLKTAKVTMFLGVPLLFNKLIKGIMKKIKAKGVFIYGIVRFLMGFSGFMKKVFNVKVGKKIFKGLLQQASLYDIRILISGGAPLPPETFKQFNELGLDFIQGYGMTETSPIIALNPVEHFKIKSVGKILPQLDVKIELDEGKKIGEIVIKGPIVMKGYYKNQEATYEIMNDQGYLKTGDMGYLDKENYLYLTGRKKNIIVTEGGKNVFPEEIEYYYELEDGIEQVMVKGFLKENKVGSEDIEAIIHPNYDYYYEKYGDIVKDDITIRVKEEMEEKRNRINSKFPPYKQVKRVMIMKDPMEMTSTKKIKRFKVNK
ncbi:AMP-binding protein [bacterium]|nr:AMP-binding protein [bacterium]